MDDSEVTLNICLGKQFSGGELFFRGVRCDEHVNTETQPEVCLLIDNDLLACQFIFSFIILWCIYINSILNLEGK